MSTKTGSDTEAMHTHGEHCEVCGRRGVERSYQMNDRLTRTLFVALCKTMNLEPGLKSKRPLAPIYVIAPDTATHDRLLARYDELAASLDDKLIALTTDFIREHLGIEIKGRRQP